MLDAEAMGKPRGGLTTKIHVAVGALGNSVRLLLTSGQALEYGQAEALLDGLRLTKSWLIRVMIHMRLLKAFSELELKRLFHQERTANNPGCLIDISTKIATW